MKDAMTKKLKTFRSEAKDLGAFQLPARLLAERELRTRATSARDEDEATVRAPLVAERRAVVRGLHPQPIQRGADWTDPPGSHRVHELPTLGSEELLRSRRVLDRPIEPPCGFLRVGTLHSLLGSR